MHCGCTKWWHQIAEIFLDILRKNIYKFSSTIISKWIKILIWLKLNYTCCNSKGIKIQQCSV